MRTIHQKKNDLGRFDSLEHLWRCMPNGASSGDYAHIGNEIFIWDEHQQNWMLDTLVNTDSYLLLEQSGDLDLFGDLRVGGRMIAWHRARFKGDVTIEGKLVCRHIKQHDRGFFPDAETLMHTVPSPMRGDWALVGTNERPQLWQCTTHGEWERVGETNLENAFNLEAYNNVRDIVEDIANTGYVFEGVARPETNPRRPNDHNIFYLSSQPGKYVHFGNIEVRNVSALLWTLGEDGTGGWTAKTLLDDIIIDTRNIVDGAVSLEKLSDGVIKYFDDKDRALDAKIINLRQQLSGTVKSITINGSQNTKHKPDNSGNVNLVIAQGGGGEDESLAEQVQQNTDDIADIKQMIEDGDVGGGGDCKVVLITQWMDDDPQDVSGQEGEAWYNPVTKKLYIHDETQWQETPLDINKLYVNLVFDQILGFDGDDFWLIASNADSKRLVVVCKAWIPNSPNDTIFPAGTHFQQGDFAYAYNLHKLYVYDQELQTWNEAELYDTCLYIHASQNKAYRWNTALLDMVPITQTITVDAALSPTSTNPVQNKVINTEISALKSQTSTLNSQTSSLQSGLSSLAATVAGIIDSDSLKDLWTALLGIDHLVPLRHTPPVLPEVGTQYLDLDDGKVMECRNLNGSPSTFIVRLRLQAKKTKTVQGQEPLVIRPCEGEEISLLIDEGWDLGFANDLPSRTATTYVSRFKQALEDAGYSGKYTATDEQASENPIIDNERSVRFVIQTLHNRPLETLLNEEYILEDKTYAFLRGVLFVAKARQQAYYGFVRDADTQEFISADDNVDGAYDTYAEVAQQPDQNALIPLMIQINEDAEDILAIANEIRELATEIASLTDNIVTKTDDDWQRIVNQPAMYGAGPTADRPSEPIEGMCYYDTDIQKPVWAHNAAAPSEDPDFEWLDATGQDPYV
ncbi:MAG: hypothetical protein IKQ77_16290 [Prevotella sp.]|nr:hypothetical protein [Prevotella sp.]